MPPHGAALYWTGGGGHAVVIVGWDEQGAADDQRWVLVNDPWPAGAGVTHRWVRWDHFKSSTETVDGYDAHELGAVIMDVRQAQSGAESNCASDISQPPADFELERWGDLYDVDKYLTIEHLGIEVVATATVDDELMRESCRLIEGMVTAIDDPAERALFVGHQATLITDADPDISTQGGVAGQRNTGGAGFSLFNTDLVCATHADTINSNPPTYRAWNTPVHEFGHAIELTLDLRDDSNDVYSANQSGYSAQYAGEYFAWSAQAWFNNTSHGGERSDMEDWAYDYFATVFDVDNTWSPECPPDDVDGDRSSGSESS